LALEHAPKRHTVKNTAIFILALILDSSDITLPVLVESDYFLGKINHFISTETKSLSVYKFYDVQLAADLQVQCQKPKRSLTKIPVNRTL